MKILKKIWMLLATGGVGLLLSACYGAMVENYQSKTKGFRVLNAGSTPIPGLKVTSSLASDRAYTDTNGSATLSFSSSVLSSDTIDVKIEDVDGTANGSYQNTNFNTTLGDGSAQEVIMKVSL